MSLLLNSLPQEPVDAVALSPAQAALTERHLLPALGALEAFFLAVRASVDGPLQQASPVRLGKPYPLGQCLEITKAVQSRLRCKATLRRELSGNAAALQGHAALVGFLRAGGAMRRVWGDLRGEFFQNAFQLGTLYVDVSNDTVTPTKPKVEILPFAQACFTPIADFLHFARIAERYWKGRVYANHALPSLAPFCPLVYVAPHGAIGLLDPTRYMVALAMAGRFAPSAKVLRGPTMPDSLFGEVTRALSGSALANRLAPSPEAGRAEALRLCADYRARRWHRSQLQAARIVHAVHQVNRRLTECQSTHAHPGTTDISQKAIPSMQPKLTINNVDYDIQTLSADARAQLQSIQFVDQEVARLQAHIAALQTARIAYVKALQAALPTGPGAGGPD
jgi:hypothetical protein